MMQENENDKLRRQQPEGDNGDNGDNRPESTGSPHDPGTPAEGQPQDARQDEARRNEVDQPAPTEGANRARDEEGDKREEEADADAAPADANTSDGPESEEEIERHPDAHGDDPNEVVITAQHVRKAFGRKEVLKDVNLELRRGENVVVLGKSGTGKSVMIKCIVGLLRPDDGKLEVLGYDVPSLGDRELAELRRKVGFLFQSGALYDSMSVRQNMLFPLERNRKDLSRDEMTKLVEETLENVGLLDAIDKMPNELSGGMRKRIGLARTLILKPEIMLYDEPTTGLDPVTSREISELIVAMQKKYNISSIIITHDMVCARIVANRVVVLKEGEYVENGTYDEVSKSEDPFVADFFK